MIRYAGIKNNNIYIVSDREFIYCSSVIKIPTYLDSISSEDLIINYKYTNNSFNLKNKNKLAKDCKVAFINNWKMRCGIATYSEFLYSKLIKNVGDYKFFIEKNKNPTSQNNILDDTILPEDKFIECWERGNSLLSLVKEIKVYNPDVIIIQHEFGLFPNARYWISLLCQLSKYRIIVTMHSVFHHKDKAICEAAMPEIIVHIEGAKELLEKEKCVSGKVVVIPHGCFPCDSKEKLWNLYKSDHTIVQFGFGFRYKSYDNSIRAVSLLKEKYPDIFFTGLFSESPFNKIDHDIYYNELMQLVEELSLQDNIGIIRGFQSDQVLDSYIRTNKIAVFPYVSHINHEVFGASGAARLAMTKNIPIITSNTNHFKDIPSIKADSPEKMADEIDKLFSSKKEIENQLHIQNEYLESNSWEKIAAKYISVIDGNSA